MKKILSLALVALVSLTIAACDSSEPVYSPPSSAQPSQSAAVESNAPESNAPSESDTQPTFDTQTPPPVDTSILPGSSEEPETITPEIPISDAVDEDMVTKLTPEGATVAASEAGSLVLSTDLGNDALKEFYLGVLPGLNVTEVESMDAETGWQYVGSYGDGKELTISVILLGETQNVAITY